MGKKAKNKGGGGQGVTRADIMGMVTVLRGIAPPPYNSRPWYPLVVSHVIEDANLELYVSNKDIIRYIISQLGLNAADATVINFKLSHVTAWAMSTATSPDRPAIAMDCSSLVPQVEDAVTSPLGISYPVLCSPRDQGNLSEAAKVGYKWPLAQQAMPLGNTAEHTVVAVAGNTANVNIRFHIKWNTTGDAVPPPI